jgi:hypothetical protein
MRGNKMERLRVSWEEVSMSYLNSGDDMRTNLLPDNFLMKRVLNYPGPEIVTSLEYLTPAGQGTSSYSVPYNPH